MHSQFHAVADPLFHQLKTEDRLRFARQHYPHLALTSSFGIQSIAMIELLDRAGISIPVVTVDIAGDQYDPQRRYRDRLHNLYAFDLHVFKAADETQKVAALEQGLQSLGITATLDGIRASQTANRATKDFIETKAGGRTALHPLLDWPDGRMDWFLVNLDMNKLHPSWQPGAQSKGGLVLLQGAQKTECGLHVA